MSKQGPIHDEPPDGKIALIYVKVLILMWTTADPPDQDRMALLLFLIGVCLIAMLMGSVLLKSWRVFFAAIRRARHRPA